MASYLKWVERLNRYREGHGFETHRNLPFFRFDQVTPQVVAVWASLALPTYRSASDLFGNIPVDSSSIRVYMRMHPKHKNDSSLFNHKFKMDGRKC